MMSHHECGVGSVGTVEEPPKKDVPSETEFVDLVRQHRAKVFTVSGRLRWYQHRYILTLDGGGQWLVDGPSRLYRYAGQRVTVEGTRFGFNGIDVARFKLENGDWPVDSLWDRMKRWFGARLWLTLCPYLIYVWWQHLSQIEPLSAIIFKHLMHL
jgi:hypothetical protein